MTESIIVDDEQLLSLGKLSDAVEVLGEVRRRAVLKQGDVTTLIAAILLTVSPLEKPLMFNVMSPVEANVTKKRKSASSGSGRKFSGCAAARRAGYTPMWRGKTGYSLSLDRDGDEVAV